MCMRVHTCVCICVMCTYVCMRDAGIMIVTSSNVDILFGNTPLTSSTLAPRLIAVLIIEHVFMLCIYGIFAWLSDMRTEVDTLCATMCVYVYMYTYVYVYVYTAETEHSVHQHEECD